MEISREISNAPQEYDPVWLEAQLRRIQQELFTLREFLEPAVKLNEGAPNQAFNPLE